MMPDDNYLKCREKDAALKKSEKISAGIKFTKNDFDYENIPHELLEYRYLNRALQHYYLFANQIMKVPIYKVWLTEPG
jgi:hypothetical protein